MKRPKSAAACRRLTRTGDALHRWGCSGGSPVCLQRRRIIRAMPMASSALCRRATAPASRRADAAGQTRRNATSASSDTTGTGFSPSGRRLHPRHRRGGALLVLDQPLDPLLQPAVPGCRGRGRAGVRRWPMNASAWWGSISWTSPGWWCSRRSSARQLGGGDVERRLGAVGGAQVAAPGGQQTRVFVLASCRRHGHGNAPCKRSAL